MAEERIDLVAGSGWPSMGMEWIGRAGEGY